MNTANELIETARLDLEAARILYRNKLYPQSIFLFQQSVEKAHKAACLSWRLIEEEKLKSWEIGHKATGIYKKHIEKRKKMLEELKKDLNENQKLKNVFEDQDFEKVRRALDEDLLDLKKLEKSDIDMSLREIKSLIADIKKLKAIKIKLEKEQFNGIIIAFFAPLLDISAKFDPKKADELKQDMEKSLEKLDYDKSEVSKYFFNSLYVAISLPLIAFITSPHSTASRYPETNSTPRKIYTKKLPLVKMLPELMELHKEALRRLKSLQSKELPSASS